MSLLKGFIYRQFIHYPPAPTASFKDQTVIVTGSSSGLGLEACRSIVRFGASQVILACRNIEKAKAAAKDIEATTSCNGNTLQVWHLDLSSYDSVQAFAERAKAELPRLDVLIANAGIGTMTFRKTEDNEETITTNVVSLALLAFLLFPKLHETAKTYGTQTHLTVTGSELYEIAKFEERKAPTGQIFLTLNDKEKAKMMDRYSVSKLMVIFIIKQMAALAPLISGRVIINCVAPGLCQSELHRDYDSAVARFLLKRLARPTEVGARTLVYGASASTDTHGQYVPDCKVTPVGGLAKNAEVKDRVWEELRTKLEAIRPGVTSLS